MNKYICIKECELKINNHIKKFKKGQEVDENLFTKRFKYYFKKIGELYNIGHLSKIIFKDNREPEFNIKSNIKVYNKGKKKKKIFKEPEFTKNGK